MPQHEAIKELDKTLRLAKWVGKHESSCFVDVIPSEEMEQTFMYSLKDINNSMDGFDFFSGLGQFRFFIQVSIGENK